MRSAGVVWHLFALVVTFWPIQSWVGAAAGAIAKQPQSRKRYLNIRLF